MTYRKLSILVSVLAIFAVGATGCEYYKAEPGDGRSVTESFSESEGYRDLVTRIEDLRSEFADRSGSGGDGELDATQDQDVLPEVAPGEVGDNPADPAGEGDGGTGTGFDRGLLDKITKLDLNRIPDLTAIEAVGERPDGSNCTDNSQCESDLCLRRRGLKNQGRCVNQEEISKVASELNEVIAKAGKIDVMIEPQSVTGLQLVLQTGNIPGAGTDTGGTFMFDLCPTSNFDSQDCFRARFNDKHPNHLTLNNGAYETIDFGQDPHTGPIIDPTKKDLRFLKYPDDFKYFRIAADPNSAVRQAWLLQGVELRVKAGANNSPYLTVYRNPCVGRWIESSQRRGNCNNCYSPHSIENDNAFCLYAETGSAPNSSTNDTVFAVIPMEDRQTFSQSTRTWIDAYRPSEAPVIQPNNGLFTVPLHYADIQDFGKNGDNENGDSYTFTVYDGADKVKSDQIQLTTNGNNAVQIHRVIAYSFKPGDRKFIDDKSCYAGHWQEDFWLSRENSDSNVITHWPGPSTYKSLNRIGCPATLMDIRIDKCSYPFGIHTNEHPDYMRRNGCQY